MARYVGIFFLGVITAWSAGCSKFAVKWGTSVSSEVEWHLAGANRERTSSVAKTLAPPLYEVARFKLSSAVGQNLFTSRGFLFAPTLDGRVFAIDLERLIVAGKKKLPGGNAATLSLGNDGLVVAQRYGRETLIYFDLATGKKVWDIDAGDIASEPLVADSVIYVSALYEHADAYHLGNGRRIWRFRTDGNLHASPVLSEGILIIASNRGKVYALRSETGKQIWQFDVEQPILATPAIYHHKIFLGTARDQLAALDLYTGEVVWQRPSTGRVFQSPAVNDRLLVFGFANGELRAFEPETGKPKWTAHAGSVVGTTPLLAGDHIYFGSLDHKLYCLDANNGEVLWRQELRGRVRTNPILWNHYLIVASEDRYLYVFGKQGDAETD